MSKYYKPGIEEFHVGFEYEYSDLDHDLKTTKWFKESVPIEFNSSYYLELLSKEDWIRVKYLDRDDIEDLGFVDQNDRGMSENYGYLFYIEDPDVPTYYTELRFWKNTRRVQIKGGLVNKVFDGFLKNKSELKQILKQLGIIDEGN